LAKNARLKEIIESEQEEAQEGYEQTKQAFRVYKDFVYRTLDSWSKERRVIGKAEHLAKGVNPRFVVTSLEMDEINAKCLYENEYCARGENGLIKK